jgi:hypothetical protein
VALERNNTALEFEAMLRRHLAQGGAIVAACAGFDPDAASAYLEGALTGTAHATFETHLAGCPACRRHFIEFSRLAYSLTPPAPVSAPRSLWDQLQVKLANWFEPAEWNWHWAPVGAAAGALVLAMMAAQLWQQPNSGNANQVSVAANATVETSAPSVQPTQSVLALDNQPLPSPTAVIADNNALVRREVPKPSVEAQAMNSNLMALNQPLAATQRAIDFTNSAPQAPLVIVREQIESLPAPPPSVNAGAAPLTISNRSAFNIEAPASFVATEIETPQPMIAARLSPPAEANPARRGKVKLEQPANPSWRNRVLGFMPMSKAETERKPTSEDASTDATRTMAVRINDKLFRFERGVLVDQAYKDEMQWRVLKLVRGSREYEQVLAAEPQLKEFFARGAILIIWKDKIYKVVGQ